MPQELSEEEIIQVRHIKLYHTFSTAYLYSLSVPLDVLSKQSAAAQRILLREQE